MAREGIMLAYAFTEKRFKSYPKPCIVQPKLEGDRMRVPFDQYGKPTLYSSGAKEKLSVPHIHKRLRERGLPLKNMELDGELYVHGMPHEQIRSITSRTRDLHPQHEEMEYHVFDLVSEQPQMTRLSTLKFLEEQLFPIIVVEYKLVYTMDQLDELYGEYVELGYEGIIIRNPKAPYFRRKTVTMQKLKPTVSEEFEVISFEEERTMDTREPKGRLGTLCCRTFDGEDFEVGTGYTHKVREDLWAVRETLPGKWVKVRYQALTEDRQVPKMSSFEGFVDKP